MEASEDRDPGYDDWFDEPEPLTETQSSANRGVYEDDEEVWVLPEEEHAGGPGRRDFAMGGHSLTMTQLAIIAVSVLAVFFGVLAAFGVFNGKAASPTAAPLPKVKPPTQNTTHTQTNTQPTAEAPSQTLDPGATGSQVKILQTALASLGYPSGKPDGIYGTATQSAVEKFQLAKGLAEDGVVGPATLAALQRALSG